MQIYLSEKERDAAQAAICSAMMRANDNVSELQKDGITPSPEELEEVKILTKVFDKLGKRRG